MTPNLERIDHIHVYVSNRVSATEWYSKVLGLSKIPEFEFWASDGGPLTISNSSGSIHLALFERPAEKRHSTIAFSTSATEFLAWQTHLTNFFGHEIKAIDHELSWSLYFADPDGNPFEITSYDYSTLASHFCK